MQIHSKFSITLFLITLVILITWGFFVVGDRYSDLKKEEKKIEKQESQQKDQSTNISDGSSEEIFTEDPVDDEDEEQVPVEEDTFVQVLPQDCDNGCKNYQQEEDIKYCKQICGLEAPKKEATGCEAMEDLEKDYCYKDQAISKTDPKVCDKIEDAGIKKACKNRVLEDIVDKQMEVQ